MRQKSCSTEGMRHVRCSSFTFSERLALHSASLEVRGTVVEAEEKVVLKSQEGVHSRIGRRDWLPISRAGPRLVCLEEAS